MSGTPKDSLLNYSIVMTINRTLSLICKSSTAIMRIWERPEFYFFNKHHRLIWYFLKVEFAKPVIDQILWSAAPKENKPTTKGCFLLFRYLYKQFSEPENRKLVRSFWMDTFAPPRLMLIWTPCVAPFPRKWPLSKAEVADWHAYRHGHLNRETTEGKLLSLTDI